MPGGPPRRNCTSIYDLGDSLRGVEVIVAPLDHNPNVRWLASQGSPASLVLPGIGEQVAEEVGADIWEAHGDGTQALAPPELLTDVGLVLYGGVDAVQTNAL
jgi:hypothetical protein